MRVRATGACFRSGLELARTLTLTLPRRVLGLDYSEAMLRETSRRFDTEGAPRDALTLVRADAAQQPSSNPNPNPNPNPSPSPSPSPDRNQVLPMKFIQTCDCVLLEVLTH